MFFRMAFALYLRRHIALSIPEIVTRPWSTIKSLYTLPPDDFALLLHLFCLIQDRVINFNEFYISLTQLRMFADVIHSDFPALPRERQYRSIIIWCPTLDTSPFHSRAPFSAYFYLLCNHHDTASLFEVLASFLFDFFCMWSANPVIRLGFVADEESAHIGGVILFDRDAEYLFSMMAWYCCHIPPPSLINGWPVTCWTPNGVNSLRHPVFLHRAFRAGRFLHIL